jgi:protocatechuate 3,4-dioxygenase, beta subunit
MKPITIVYILINLFSLTACSQNSPKEKDDPKQLIGGRCEGCEAVFESPIPFDKLSWTDTLPDYNEPGPKMMISGVIYQADGKTPAKDIVLYIYHTDQKGEYTDKYKGKGWERRHGYIRGWMKTNEKGQYRFYTLRPASYPNTSAVQHIHPTIKEPGKNEYWIDEFVFDDDPFLTPGERKHHQQRGGDGIIKLKNENGILVGERNIYLGKNIPDYPKASNRTKDMNSTAVMMHTAAENPFLLSALIPHWESILQ